MINVQRVETTVLVEMDLIINQKRLIKEYQDRLIIKVNQSRKNKDVIEAVLHQVGRARMIAVEINAV